MSKKPRVTPAELQAMAEALAAGASIAAIADRFGRDDATVRGHLVRLGVYQGQATIADRRPDLVERVRQLRSEGRPWEWIAKEVGHSSDTIRRWVQEDRDAPDVSDDAPQIREAGRVLEPFHPVTWGAINTVPDWWTA